MLSELKQDTYIEVERMRAMPVPTLTLLQGFNPMTVPPHLFPGFIPLDGRAVDVNSGWSL